MKKTYVKHLILGAGPAGLTFSNKLMQMGENNFLILEREQTAGGLCRSENVDGSPLDVGGGHFLDVRRKEVNEFLFQFMPEEEWNRYERDSRIYINGNIINHPIEANIWQMKMEDQVKYLKSIAIAGCNLEKEMPINFVDWIYWKLGKRIAEEYMLPYNRKMFGKELDRLGTYWLEKLPNVSFEETLLSCLSKKAYGKQPAHSEFYYPKKYGYGELWRRMAEAVKNNIEYGKSVCGIDFNTKTVITVDGNQYQADKIVTTIPWMEFNTITGMPEAIKNLIRELKYTSVVTEYHSENLDTNAHWIYFPDEIFSYHRILVRHNFCTGSRGYWTETNAERFDTKKRNNSFRYLNKYAYPLNTVDKPEIMKKILGWSGKKGVIGLGRWGEHQHYNSDVTVELALRMAEEIMHGGN